MKKEDLIELGIDEEVAKSVMVMHGKTVTTLNGQVSTLTAERDSLQEQVTTNQTELDSLKESAKGNEELTSQLAELQTKLDQSKTDSDTKLSEQQKDFSIKLALKEASAMDEDIVLGLLDKDTIKVVDGKLQGFDEQLKGLQESKAFLFNSAEPTDPVDPKKPSVLPGNPKPSGGETNAFKDAVSKFI